MAQDDRFQRFAADSQEVWMLGAIIGDIAGSIYEFNNYRRKDFQPFFHPYARFTDNTVSRVRQINL